MIEAYRIGVELVLGGDLAAGIEALIPGLTRLDGSLARANAGALALAAALGGVAAAAPGLGQAAAAVERLNAAMASTTLSAVPSQPGLGLSVTSAAPPKTAVPLAATATPAEAAVPVAGTAGKTVPGDVAPVGEVPMPDRRPAARALSQALQVAAPVLPTGGNAAASRPKRLAVADVPPADVVARVGHLDVAAPPPQRPAPDRVASPVAVPSEQALWRPANRVRAVTPPRVAGPTPAALEQVIPTLAARPAGGPTRPAGTPVKAQAPAPPYEDTPPQAISKPRIRWPQSAERRPAIPAATPLPYLPEVALAQGDRRVEAARYPAAEPATGPGLKTVPTGGVVPDRARARPADAGLRVLAASLEQAAAVPPLSRLSQAVGTKPGGARPAVGPAMRPDAAEGAAPGGTRRPTGDGLPQSRSDLPQGGQAGPVIQHVTYLQLDERTIARAVTRQQLRMMGGQVSGTLRPDPSIAPQYGAHLLEL